MAKEKQRQKTLEEKDEKDKLNGVTNGDRAESVNSSSTTGTATPPSMTGGTILLMYTSTVNATLFIKIVSFGATSVNFRPSLDRKLTSLNFKLLGLVSF